MDILNTAEECICNGNDSCNGVLECMVDNGCFEGEDDGSDAEETESLVEYQLRRHN